MWIMHLPLRGLAFMGGLLATSLFDALGVRALMRALGRVLALGVLVVFAGLHLIGW